MAQITINEISQNYSYNIGTNSYCTVAMPITASWGPGYFDPRTYIENACQQIDDSKDWDAENHSDMLDRVAWQRFPATQAGLEAFVATYRGPIANYRLVDDYSYQMAMTLMTAGHDVLVCRLSPGATAGGRFVMKGEVPTVETVIVDDEPKKTLNYENHISVRAKYPGTFGNKLRVEFKNVGSMAQTSEGAKFIYYWNMIVYAVDGSGTKSAVENKMFVFDVDNATNGIPHWKEIESDFVTLNVKGTIRDFEGSDDKKSRASIVSEENYSTVIANLLGDQGWDEDSIEAVVADITNPTKKIRVNSYQLLQGGTDKGAIPSASEVRRVASRGNYSSDQKVALLQDAYDLADLRYIYNGTESDNLNTGFEFAAIERNYLYTFQFLQGGDEAKEVIDAVAGGMNIPIDDSDPQYKALKEQIGSYDLDSTDIAKLEAIRFREWIYTHLVGMIGREGEREGVFDLLKDKLAYNPNRIIASGWDDQNFLYNLDKDEIATLCQEAWGIKTVGPLHRKLMDVAYYSRCATSLLDIPKSLDKKYVYNDDEDEFDWGYAQRLARYIPSNDTFTADVQLFHSHSALMTPWGRYLYTGMERQQSAPPSFLAIMIQRAMILNQSARYEWLLPTNRRNNLKIGKMDYGIPKKLLDSWQTTEGVGVNCITDIPDLGLTLWGNSTLFEVPPATYQALANLSTRYLMNAVEDVAYRVGIGITFQYNNSQAYGTFVAGVTPILDTMKNLGAIEDYYIKMSRDVDDLSAVKSNSVLGKIYLVIPGVINDISIDLIALPAGTSLDQFRG